MTDSMYEWMLGMSAAFIPTASDQDGEDIDQISGTIYEVRDETPDLDDRHIRVVLDTEAGLVDVGHNRVDLQ